MGDLMRKILMTVAGVVVMIAIWEMKDRWFGTSSGDVMVTSFPAKVWDGGGGSYTFETDSAEPTNLEVVFHEGGHPEDNSVQEHEGARHLIVRVSVPAGSQSYTTE